VGWTARGWRHAAFTVALISALLASVVTAVPAGAGPQVPGIDVSMYQGRIRWGQVASTPVRFAIMRATMGNGYVDPTYARNVAGARAHGLVVGAYHYAKPSRGRWDAKMEADHFLRLARNEPGDILPVLDIEQTGGLNRWELRDWAGAWLDRVQARIGLKPMIYSGNHFWRTHMGNTAWFANRGHPLWVAHWHVASPELPGGRWGGRGRTFWQWSATGRVAGIHGDVDLDRFDGPNLAGGKIASLTVTPGDGGAVTGERLSCGGGEASCLRLANPGAKLTLRARPAPGAALLRWGGDCAPAGAAPICTVSAIGARTVSAVFGSPAEATTVAGAAVELGAEVAGSTPTSTPSPSPTATPSDPSGAVASTPGKTRSEAGDSDAGCAGIDQDCTVPARLATRLEVRSRSVARAEEDDAGTRYTWGRKRSPRAIGNSFRVESRAAASTSFSFRGGTVTLFTLSGPRMGKARVAIDGSTLGTFDGYARKPRARVAHRFSGLGRGAHELTVTVLGKKRPASLGTYVAVDALRWGDETRRDPKAASAPWGSHRHPSASGGAYAVSGSRGAVAKLRFTGTGVSMRTRHGPRMGHARIVVDGKVVSTVDLYAPTRRFTSIEIVSGLDPAPHVLRVSVLGTHRRVSKGSWVAIDRWDVR
jgi:GH25 family lysozyme M1 (1,4-beta-N-acetylmuramidase)